MQTVTTSYSGVVNAAFRDVNTAVQVSWNKATASNVEFFTINSSDIDGDDFIKGSGDYVTFFDKFAYADYSDYVIDWSVQRQLGQYPYGLIMAQADVEFDNTSKVFTPGYSNTIGSGILPGRPLKIAVGVGNDSLQQFVGFTGAPELTLGNRRLAYHAFDATDYINNYSFTSSGTTISGTLQNITTSGLIGYALTQMGFSNGQFVLDRSLSTPIGYANMLERKFGDVLNDALEAEQGTLFTDENGVVRFWNRQHFFTNSGTGFKFNFNRSNIVDLQYANTPIINDVIVRAKPREVQDNVLIYRLKVPVELNPGGPTTIFVNFADDYGPLPTTSVVEPTAGVGASSYFVANTQSDASGTDVSSSISVLSSFNFGTSYKLVLTNADAANYYLTELQIYGSAALVTESIEQRYTDQGSIDLYGRNPANNGEPLTIDNDFIQDDSGALSLAYQLVTGYKTPRSRFIARVFANPALQYGDYGALVVPDTSEVKRVFVTGKRDVFAPRGDMQQELILEERGVASYFTINVSSVGGLDTIAP